MQVLTVESRRRGRQTDDLMDAAESVRARVKGLELEGFELRSLEVRAHVLRVPTITAEGRDDADK